MLLSNKIFHNNRSITYDEADNLTSNGSSNLHYHSADRDRANHTGTQLSSTISDFGSAVDARVVNSGITEEEANAIAFTNSLIFG